MSGPHRMEEFKYIRGGAKLVISLDGLNWFSKRRCSDKGFKKRDEELQLWISSGQMIKSDEHPQSTTCFCILDRRGGAASQLWRTTDCRLSSESQSPSFSHLPRHCCLVQGRIQHSAFTSLDSLVTNFSQKVTGTRLNLNIRDIFRLITKDLNSVTIDQHKSFIIFCNEAIPRHLFSDTYLTKDNRIGIGNTGCHINNDVSSDLKYLAAHLPCNPSSNDTDDNQSEIVMRGHFFLGNLKSILKNQDCNNPGVSLERDGNVKMRKSVSFDGDVIVYMFDQDSPVMELHSEPCTSQPSSYSCNLSDVTLEDCGLEWEDDFSALETNCHFECVRQMQDYTFSLPTQSWTSLHRPERFSLPQTCLFLTHVTQSDLEL